MQERANTRLTKAPAQLIQVATYGRSVAASLDRVWENVLDWEHLPWLHDSSFLDIEMREGGDWGWRARLGVPNASEGRRELDLELLIQEPGDRYVSRTTRGQGAGSEIWTILAEEDPGRTRVEVEFWLPGIRAAQAPVLGDAYVALYTQLWDEDEWMMRHRQAELDRSPPALPGRTGFDLGALDLLRGRLPLDVEVDGLPFRVTLDGEDLRVHSTRCPHRLGPLGEDEIEPGVLRCPWHGYRFDTHSGASCDGRRLRLEPAPVARVDPCTARVQLVWEA